MHYRKRITKACGYAVVYSFVAFGEWIACGETAAKG